MNKKTPFYEYSTMKTVLSVWKRIERNGISIEQALEMPDSQLKEKLKYNGKEQSFQSFKRMLKIIDNINERHKILKEYGV